MAEYETKDKEEKEEAKRRKKAETIYDQLKQAAEPEDSQTGQAEAMLELQQTFGNRYVQRLVEGNTEATLDENIVKRIDAERTSGKPLEPAVRSQTEIAYRYDFSKVRIHTDAEADRLSQQLGAKAFTTGRDIFFQEGAYQPATKAGKSLLGHELTHVVQQEHLAFTVPAIQRQAAAVTSPPQGSASLQQMTAFRPPEASLLYLNIARKSQRQLNEIVGRGCYDAHQGFRDACLAIRSGNVVLEPMTPHPDSAMITQAEFGAAAGNYRAYFMGDRLANINTLPASALAYAAPGPPPKRIGIVLWRQVYPPDEVEKAIVRDMIVHEVTHTLQPEIRGHWGSFIREFQAYWMEPGIDEYLFKTRAQDPAQSNGIYTSKSTPITEVLTIVDPVNPANSPPPEKVNTLHRKAFFIVKRILTSGVYPELTAEFIANRQFHDTVLQHNDPGMPPVNAAHINAVWDTLAGYLNRARTYRAPDREETLGNDADFASNAMERLTNDEILFVQEQHTIEQRNVLIVDVRATIPWELQERRKNLIREFGLWVEGIIPRDVVTRELNRLDNWLNVVFPP
jgi:hypothetical protein